MLCSYSHATECGARTRLSALFENEVKLDTSHKCEADLLNLKPQSFAVCVCVCLKQENVAFIVQGQFLIIKKENYQ